MSRRPLPTIHPLTPDRWADFETLFGDRGACGGCWCMLWRKPRAAFEADKGAGNKADMRALVAGGAEPGLLAYRDGRPVGWCAVAPRADYPALARSRLFRPTDGDPAVWAVSCLFVAAGCRRQGVSVALLKAAVRFARGRGGAVVEGYPVEPAADPMPAAFAWTGLAAAFLRAGFREHRRASPTRPVMRAGGRPRPATDMDDRS